MKRVKIWLVTLLALIVSMFVFSSCDVLNGLLGEKQEADVVGTYKMHCIIRDGVEYGMGESPTGLTITEDMTIWEFKEDNTFVSTSNMYSITETVSGTWTEENGKITLTVDGVEVMKMTIEGDTVSFDNQGSTWVFKKVK